MNKILRCSIGAALALASASLCAADSAGIRTTLQNTGVDANALGSVLASLRVKSSEMIVSVRNLDPLHTFAVEVNGIVEASLTTDKKGRGGVRFRTKASGGAQPLDFDPRGKTLRILSEAGSVLEGVISGEGEAKGTIVDERAALEQEHLSPDDRNAHASVHFSRDRHGRRVFQVSVANVAGKGVDVWVDGVQRRHIELHGRRGSASFVDTPSARGRHDLDFDPRGKVVDITRDDSVLFSSEAAAVIPGVNAASPSVQRLSIPSTGAGADGVASARLRIDDRARKHFSVEVENLPAGAYDLLVDGAGVGVIQVAAAGTGTQGEIEFTSGDDDESELPLMFDPVGRTLVIQQAGVIYFQGAFSPSATGAPGAALGASQIIESLGSTGLDADASARAAFRLDDRGRRKFSVEIEDVPAGTYTLSVAGVVRGTLNAQLVAGRVQAEIEFEDETEQHTVSISRQRRGGDDRGGSSGGGGEAEAPSAPLGFDPRGQLLEIRSSAGVYFSHLFGNGSAVDGAAVPFDVATPLFNTGVNPGATAEAKFRQRDNGETRFEVELENLPVGSYDLVVGSAVRGVIVIGATDRGTRGQVEFESESGDPATALNFDVLGQAVTIQQGSTVLFSRVFPAE